MSNLESLASLFTRLGTGLMLCHWLAAAAALLAQAAGLLSGESVVQFFLTAGLTAHILGHGAAWAVNPGRYRGATPRGRQKLR